MNHILDFTIKKELQLAIHNNDLERVKQIVTSLNPSVLEKYFSLDIILSTLEGNHLDITKYFISFNFLTQTSLSIKKRILRAAVVHGDLEVVKMLVEKEISYTEEDSKISAFFLLGERQPFDAEGFQILEYFLEKGISINSKDRETSFTLLHFAALYGNLTLSSLLLEKKADANVKSKENETPLHIAAMNGHSQIVSLFLSKGAEYNFDTNKKSLLCLAVSSGNIQTVEILLKTIFCHEKHETCNLPSILKDDVLLIYFAVETGKKELVELLLNIGGVVNIHSPETGKTPLQLAVEYELEEIVELLLKAGADVNITENKVSCSIKNANLSGNSILHIAVKKGLEKIVQLLLDYGANSSLLNEFGQSTLELAVKKGSPTIVMSLLKHGAELTVEESNAFNNPLFFAAQIGNFEIVEILLDALSRKTPIVNFYPILYIATYQGHFKIVQKLLQEYIDPNFSFKHCLTPLHAAAQRGHYKIVELLLKSGAKSDGDLGTDDDKKFTTPLLVSLYCKHYPIAILLLHYNADPNVRVGLATKQSSTIPDVFIKGDHNLNSIECGLTPIEIAIRARRTDIVQQLLFHGADPNIKFGMNADGESPLQVAVLFNETNMVEMLLKKGAVVDVYTSESNYSSDFPLHCAINHGKMSLVKKLIQYGANINSVCGSGLTPIFHAVLFRQFKIFKFLVTNGAFISSTSAGVQNTLFSLIFRDYYFSKAEKTYMIKLLFYCGMTATKDNEKKLLNFTVRECLHNSLFTLSLEHGCDPNVLLKSEETALHYAVKNNKLNAVYDLLKHGADINIVDKKGKNPVVHSLNKLLSRIVKIRNMLNSSRHNIPLILRNFSLNDSSYFPQNRQVNHILRLVINANNDPTSYRLMTQSLVKMIAKLQAVNKKVSKENLQLIQTKFVKPYYENCLAEIASMKKYQIVYNLNLFHILVADEVKLACYARNKEIVEIYEHPSVFKEFPIYAEILKDNLQKGIERKSLIENNLNFFKKTLGINVPIIILYEIFSYLKVIDLRNLNKVWEPLKFDSDILIFNPNLKCYETTYDSA